MAQDELDLVRPVAAKVEKTEALLEKYKSRLEEAAGLKQQIKKLEERNGEVVAQNLKLESETKKIPTLQRRVDDYKKTSTDSVRPCNISVSTTDAKDVSRL